MKFYKSDPIKQFFFYLFGFLSVGLLPLLCHWIVNLKIILTLKQIKNNIQIANNIFIISLGIFIIFLLFVIF